MVAAVDALVAKSWTVDGVDNVSLLEVGYSTAGIDEGWEGCGAGVNGTQHDAAGNPTINAKFNDTGALVAYGHAKGLEMGWYENGCACGERHELEINYEGDVRNLNGFGFDGLKLDGCGAQRNMTKYAALMQATGKAYLTENCHWGRCTDSDDSSCPTAEWCPMNWYRTSGDINSSPMSWYHNLQTTIAFQDAKAPLSRPGCWAYPDSKRQLGSGSRICPPSLNNLACAITRHSQPHALPPTFYSPTLEHAILRQCSRWDAFKARMASSTCHGTARILARGAW